MTEINGKTRLCGVIGHPVEHTLSPLIHNMLAADLGHDLVYVPFHVEKDLRAAVEGAYALNILGLNVTVPYKSEVLGALRGVDETAERIGAVNTLVRSAERGGYVGYNTDVGGLRRALRMDGVSLTGRSVVLLGAGGAARAAAFLCAKEGAARLAIVNRTREKAQALAEEVRRFYPETDVRALSYEALREQTKEGERVIAIQSTSVGLYPHCDDCPVTDARFFETVEYAFDLIYRPQETAFLRRVREAGGRTANGLAMLLWQAVEAYELWNETRVDEAEAARVLEKLRAAVR